jgi:hypothetical protein
MYSLSGITIPASQVYSEDYPTRNQENFAAFLLDCAAAQKAADPIIYTDTDFYLASYNFDADTMTSFVSASNALSAEIEDSRGVIGDLLDLAATLIPVQYRFIYYLLKPFLNALAERLFHSLTEEQQDFSDLVEQLEAIDSRLHFAVNEVDMGLTQHLFQALFDPIFLESNLGNLLIAMQDLDFFFALAFLRDLETENPQPILGDLKFNDILMDFGFIRALLFSRALMT